jgi:hypothetical protein
MTLEHPPAGEDEPGFQRRRLEDLLPTTEELDAIVAGSTVR